MSRKTQKTKDSKKPVFDPKKRYAWEPDDSFSVTGEEIDIWNKALGVYVNTPEYQKFLVLQRAIIMMNNFLKEAVEEGLIKEAPEPVPVKTPVAQKGLRKVDAVTDIEEIKDNGQVTEEEAEAAK